MSNEAKEKPTYKKLKVVREQERLILYLENGQVGNAEGYFPEGCEMIYKSGENKIVASNYDGFWKIGINENEKETLNLYDIVSRPSDE